MKVTVIPMIIGALRMFPKGLEKRLKGVEISGRINIFQTTSFLRSAGILRRVLKT